MNKLAKRMAAFLAAGALSCTAMVSAFAQEFVDMPQNWTTTALENAVKNGLLVGDGDHILPDDNITRAEMAAIIVRAFGAEKTADISMYTDVEQDQWYYEELSKAVAMGAFHGDGDKMNPRDNITFQECFTVLAQIFYLEYYGADTAILTEKFTDGAEVADWAKEYTAMVVGSGYWDGIEGKLLPTTYITRSQFAVLMDNFIKTYVDEPGEYTSFEPGNVMVRTPDVSIKDVTTESDIILGEGCLDSEITFENVTCHTVLIRGGKDVSLGGQFDWIMLKNPEGTAYIGGAALLNPPVGCKGAMFDFGVLETE